MEVGVIVKLKNLNILRDNYYNVPDFTTNIDEVTWPFSAVRSSANLEDNENSSCAGLFDSFLNVSKGELSEKIDLVRDSYARNGVDRDNPVIIQKMVQSELSGIVFTANPMGILNEMVIVVGAGLGSGVVDNKVETTTYYFNIDDNLYDYEQNGSSPLLNENQIEELVEIGQSIDKLFGKKMDIEFGISNGIIYILQARPITTITEDNLIILDNSNIVESYPGVSLPLTQSFVKEIYYKIFKRCVSRISGDKALVERLDGNLQNMVDIANGRIYYRISNWYSILKLLPFEKKIIKNWQKMLGVRNLTVSGDNVRVKFWTKLKIMCNFVKYLCRTPEEMLKLNNFFDKKIVRGRAKYDKCKTISEYLELLENLKDSFIENWDITLINDMYTFIYTGLAGEKNKQLLTDIRGLESLKPVLKMNALIDAYQKHGLNSYKFKMLAKEYINLYGDRCMGELKLETRSYKTNPSLLEEYVRNQKKVIVDKEKEVPEKSNNPFVKRAKIGIGNREKSRMNRTKLFGLTRDIYLDIGKLLVKEGRLAYYRDIFYLFHDELYDKDLDYKSLVWERKTEYYNYEKIPAYSRLVFTDKIINKKNIGNISVLSDNRLQGVGVSEGIVEGEVIVIDTPNVEIDVADKIIVTKMTDPGWVFLIRNCKGVIAQQGSLLSHTAIISRELGKPAIVNVKNVLQTLRTGDRIKVNGLTGEIEKI